MTTPRPQMSEAERKLTALLKQAQRLGALDKAQGPRGGRPKMLPLVIEALGIKTKIGMDVRMMIQSMYQAGFTTGEVLAEEEG